MSQPKLPHFAETVEGVKLAQNLVPGYTSEVQNTFEKKNFEELSNYQRSTRSQIAMQEKPSLTWHVVQASLVYWSASILAEKVP